MSFSVLNLLFGVSRNIEEKNSAFSSNIFTVLVNDTCSDNNEQIIVKVVVTRRRGNSSVGKELREQSGDV